MPGAMIGDIVGSVCGHDNIKTKEFQLFQDESRFTGDAVMTAAAADALTKGGTGDDFIGACKGCGRRYPHAGCGIPISLRAKAWARLDKPLRSLCRRRQAYLANN